MLSREETNTNFVVFGITQSELEPTINHSRGEHANHYTTDAVQYLDVVATSNIVIEYNISGEIFFNSLMTSKYVPRHVS